MEFYETCIWVLPPLTYLVCLILAGLVFYKWKIKKPFLLLISSADRIAAGGLDFSIRYDGNDEMGSLCRAFEKMRAALESNNREMWRQMSERKKLNAAFSHDLRTPLTVLEGHLGILQKYTPQGKLSADDIMQTYAAMAGQIERLKDYTFSMSTLQRIEDMPINRRRVLAADFIDGLNDTAEIICESKKLAILNRTAETNISVDPEIIMQVFENLLSNAVRYAKSSVLIQYEVTQSIFSITVTDGGRVILDGQDILTGGENELAEIRQHRLGFVFQDFMLLAGLTIRENIFLPQIIAGKAKNRMEQNTQKLLYIFGIEDIAEKYPVEVSGGQKQRVSIARALSNSPSIILADELTGNLDSKSSTAVIEAFLNAKGKMGAAIFMVTHDAFAASYADRVIALKDGIVFGELVRHGRSEDFLDELLDFIER